MYAGEGNKVNITRGIGLSPVFFHRTPVSNQTLEDSGNKHRRVRWKEGLGAETTGLEPLTQ